MFAVVVRSKDWIEVGVMKPYVKTTHTQASLRAKPAKSPFGYYGAKLRIAQKIIGRLPPHNAWVEAFCGSAAITLAKKPVPIEVINDVDGEIINLFDQLRGNPAALCCAVALTPYARAEFQKSRMSPKRPSNIERARRFLVRSMMTVNATVGSTACGFSFSQSYAREGHEARVNRWNNLPARLDKVFHRLQGVRVENRDARELVKMFADRPATLMYLDPPYFTKRDHGYVIDANDEGFHTELLKVCSKAKCMLLISAYENELYDRLLTKKGGWKKWQIQTHTRDTSGKDYDRTEVLWMNAPFVKAWKTRKVPIRLSKSERQQNKINPARPNGKQQRLKKPKKQKSRGR
jgi:DNA adenine methylase